MNSLLKIHFRKRRRLTSLLGLALDGSRLEGVVLKRTNGALQCLQRFSAALTLDPLTAAPELAGREIRNHLDAAGVRERRCVVGLPLQWVLTAQTELPPLPEADAASLLQLEAERLFPTDVATLQLARSLCTPAAALMETAAPAPTAPGAARFVLLAGIPSAHLTALETVLAAAKLKPVSFTLGITALQRPEFPASLSGTKSPTDRTAGQAEGVLALAIGESRIGLQITAGGGVAALRSINGAIENISGRAALVAGVAARECRITLGQLPAGLRETIRRIRIFGPRELAQQLADELELRFESSGLQVEIVSAYAPAELGLALPPEAPVSAAFSLAARALADQAPVFEFLPPRPTAIEQFIARYSSGRWRTVGAAAAALVLVTGGLFLVQQIQLWRLRSQWAAMSARVEELQTLQSRIQQYQPWFDETFRDLAILRQLSLAFPQEGSVTARIVDIHADGTVSCSGNARDQAALRAVLGSLGKANGVSALKLDLIQGKSPMQFTFDFQYLNGGANEN
jgi:hypothetical protein